MTKSQIKAAATESYVRTFGHPPAKSLTARQIAQQVHRARDFVAERHNLHAAHRELVNARWLGR